MISIIKPQLSLMNFEFILVQWSDFLGILVAAVSKTYSMATHINMGTNVLFSCLCGKFYFNLLNVM